MEDFEHFEGPVKQKPAYTILDEPLNREQIEETMDEHDFVSGVVEIGLNEFIEYTYEGILDLMSERLIGNDLLMAIDYDVVGHEGNMLHIRVAGDVSEALGLI